MPPSRKPSSPALLSSQSSSQAQSPWGPNAWLGHLPPNCPSLARKPRIGFVTSLRLGVRKVQEPAETFFQ